MKVLGIVCSPRKEGNTEIMVREALDAAREAGAETELVLVADKKIAPCDGCGVCRDTGFCKVKDDMQPIYQQMEAVDAIIFGTPVYFGNVSAQAKAIMDRTYVFLGKRDGDVRRLRGKVAGAIVVTRRLGGQQTLGLLYTFFLAHEMVAVRGGVGYGRQKGEVREGVGGAAGSTALGQARFVGSSVVQLARQLARGTE